MFLLGILALLLVGLVLFDERRTVITLWYQPRFDALPERVKAQMAKKTQRSPEWWPSEARALLDPLLPHYDGDAEPYGRDLYRRRGAAAY